MKIEIRHRQTEEIIYEAEGQNIREVLERAIKEGANLLGAYLRGAYLGGAYLEGVNLEGANHYLNNHDIFFELVPVKSRRRNE